MYTTSGGRSRGKIVSSLRKRFGVRQRNPLHDYANVYICMYIYTHILVATVQCEILSIRCIFYHINICTTALSYAHVYMVTKITLPLKILCNTRDVSSQH